MQPNVIDIYHGDTVVDFAEVKAAGVLGVIHKASQGAGYADPLYAERRKDAMAAGLLWGAYAFNTGENIQAQVKMFLDHAQPDEHTLVALDFEDNPHSQMSLDQARTWLDLVEAALGRKPVLYSGNRVKDMLGRKLDPLLGRYRLWLPQYGPAPKPQASWSQAWLWQYSDKGRVPGIRGNVDVNYFNGTPQELALSWAT